MPLHVHCILGIAGTLRRCMHACSCSATLYVLTQLAASTAAVETLCGVRHFKKLSCNAHLSLGSGCCVAHSHTCAAVVVPPGASTQRPARLSVAALHQATHLPLAHRPALQSKRTTQAATRMRATYSSNVHLDILATCAGCVRQDMDKSSPSHAGSVCCELLWLCCMCWLYVSWCA
jgi:hypothetical protein